ncbi:hypothetical protein PFISCL1PPCAC_9220, partial [Pristionchus fissidentatus]
MRRMAEEGEEGQWTVNCVVYEDSSREKMESFPIQRFLEELRERRNYSDEEILTALKESRRKREVGGVEKVGGVEDKTTLEFFVDSFEKHLEKQIVDAEGLHLKAMVRRKSVTLNSVQAYYRKRDDALFDRIDARMKKMEEESEKKEEGVKKKGGAEPGENGTVHVEESSGCSLM